VIETPLTEYCYRFPKLNLSIGWQGCETCALAYGGTLGQLRATVGGSIFWGIPTDDILSYPIGSMYGIYANIGGILMVNVTIYSSTMDPMGILSKISIFFPGKVMICFLEKALNQTL
jgi:hypothetical protein